MILDGAYLCHIWRLEFAPLHDYVQRQPSHPDDIAINLLIQYMSGKGPRVYPQVNACLRGLLIAIKARAFDRLKPAATPL